MPFDFDKFAAAKFEARTERIGPEILADGLKAFFSEGDDVCWIVRGLDGREMYFCREAEKRYKQNGALLEALQGGQADVGAVRKALGLDPKQTTPDMARRLEVLVLGSVYPTVKLEHAVLIAERFASDFNYFTNKIELLTGQGFDLVKREAASQPTADSTSA